MRALANARGSVGGPRGSVRSRDRQGAVALVFFLLAATAAFAQIPTPESVLGHKPGDDFYLATYEDSLGYFQKLAASSNRC